MVPYATAHVLHVHVFSSVALTQYKVSLNLKYMTLYDYSGIILACAMAQRFLKWRIEIFAMRHNGPHFFVTAHQQNLDAP